METGTVAEQTVVEDFRHERPFFGLLAVNSGEIDLCIESDVVRTFVRSLIPGNIATPFDFRHDIPCTIDVDLSGTGDIMVRITIHLGDGRIAIAFIYDNENRRHTGRTLVSDDLQCG